MGLFVHKNKGVVYAGDLVIGGDLDTFPQEDLESALNLKRLAEGENVNVSVSQKAARLEASYTKEQLESALKSKGVELG